MKLCTEPGCDRPRYARGLCKRDYMWHRRHGFIPDIPECTTEYCTSPAYAFGLCDACYHRTRRTKARTTGGKS